MDSGARVFHRMTQNIYQNYGSRYLYIDSSLEDSLNTVQQKTSTF